MMRLWASYKKKKFFFGILCINEDRSQIRNLIHQSEVRIRIRSKMSRITKTGT
jgi:hypothetical protein